VLEVDEHTPSKTGPAQLWDPEGVTYVYVGNSHMYMSIHFMP